MDYENAARSTQKFTAQQILATVSPTWDSSDASCVYTDIMLDRDGYCYFVENKIRIADC